MLELSQSFKCDWEDEMHFLCTEGSFPMWMVVTLSWWLLLASCAVLFLPDPRCPDKRMVTPYAFLRPSATLTAGLQLCLEISAAVFYTTKALKFKTAFGISYSSTAEIFLFKGLLTSLLAIQEYSRDILLPCRDGAVDGVIGVAR